MKNTLYIKFILIYLAFGFAALFATASLGRTLTKDHLIEEETTHLNDEVNLIASQTLPIYFRDDRCEADVKAVLNPLCSALQAEAWVVAPDGKLLLWAGEEGLRKPSAMLSSFDPGLLSGKSHLKGDYNGWFEEEALTVMAPITRSLTTYGYLIFHKPCATLERQTDTIMHGVYMTFGVVYILSFSILLAFHFLIYRPLETIAKAAKEYALGNLSYEIPVRHEDEIGTLSASLNYMSTHLKDMETYQKNFISNVSHDFRSPLTSIKGYAQAMSDGTIPPELYKKYLGVILFETERLSDLTQDLLTLNEFEKPDLLLDRSVFDLHACIKTEALRFEKACLDKDIHIELLLASQRLYVNADRRKIAQVIYNLIDNAVKFSFDHSHIEIETTPRGDKVFCSVKDHGLGIPSAALPKVFDRFFKTDLSRGKDKKGTGLGLAIVKEIMSAHGENINVISTENVGTEFVFSLPCLGKEKAASD